LSSAQDASTYWDSNRAGYVILIPKRPVSAATEFFSLFMGQLLVPTDGNFYSQQTVPTKVTGAAVDDWADVSLDHSGNASVMETRATTCNFELFPDPDAMPRPDELLLQPPYYLSVHTRSRNEIEILSSHSPSLCFLAAYLKRWRRSNHKVIGSVSCLAFISYTDCFQLLFRSIVLNSIVHSF
jgi:hypothetical protein